MSNLQLKVQIAAIDKITAPLRGIAKQSQRLSQGYKADMRGYNSTLKQTENALKGVRDTQRRMAQAGKPISRASIEAEQALTRRINETNAALNRRRELMDREMGAIRRRQAAMDRGKEQMMRGAKMTGTAAAATYAGARFMMPGFDFDEQMSKVQALTRMNANDPMLAKLREQAKELGATTWASATQAADAQGFYAMAGFDPKAIMDALPSTLDLAKAGGVDVGRAADIGSNILSAFGLDPSEMNNVADILVSVFTRTNTSIEMLGETMKYVGPVARELKIPLEESAAMAGILGNVGIQGGQAGTALRALQSRLAAPPAAAAKALKTLQVQTKDAAGNFRAMPDILADVMKATEKLGSADKMGYLKAIAGEEAGAAFASFLNENSYEELMKVIEAARNADGEAARTAETMSKNVKGDWTGLLSAIESVQINVSELETGGIRSLIQSVTEMIRKFSDWIKANPKFAGTLFRVTAGIIAIVGGLGALSIAMAIFNMTVLANPIVLVIAAIIAAVVALVYYKDEIWSFFKSFASAPGVYIKKAISYMNNLIDTVANLIGKIPIIGPLLKRTFEATMIPLRMVFFLINKVIDAFEWLGDTWVSPTIDTSGFENLFDVARGAIDFLLDIRNSISDLLGKIPVIGPALQFIFDLMSLPFAILMQAIKKVIEGFEWVGDNWNTIAGWFASLWGFVLKTTQPVVDLFLMIIDLINKMITGIKEAFSFEAPEWVKATGSTAGGVYDYFADSLSYTGGLIGDQMDSIFGRNKTTPAQTTAAMAIMPAMPVRNNHITNKQDIHVEVNTATNASPQAIGGAVATVIAKKQSFIGDEY